MDGSSRKVFKESHYYLVTWPKGGLPPDFKKHW